MRVSEFIGHFAVVTSSLKTKTVNRTRFAGLQALPWWDVATMAALLAWGCALIYIQRFHQTFVLTDVIIDYLPAAQKFLEGYGSRSFVHEDPVGPGYPLMLAVTTTLVRGDMFAAGKVISVMSSVLFLLFAYLLLRRVFDSITALAAVLLIKLEHLDEWNALRRQHAAAYNALFAGGDVVAPYVTDYAAPVYPLYVIQVYVAEVIIRFLGEQGC